MRGPGGATPTRSPKHARYGPPDRYDPPPGAGMCLSAFALVRKGGKTLVGRPEPGAAWDAWMPSWKHHAPEELAPILEGWLIPGTYLHEGEDPRRTVDRVMRRMLGVRDYAVSDRPLVYNATAPSGWYPGHRHWDLALVYDVRAKSEPRAPKLWRELAWKRPAELRARTFNWNSDLAKALGVASR